LTLPEDSSARRNFQILHGDDTFSIQREIRRVVQQLSSDFDAGMNTLRLDGKSASLEEISTAVTTLPFFGGDRLVILEPLPAKLDKSRQEKLIKILDGVPESTILLMVVEDHQRWRKEGSDWQRSWDILTSAHWLMNWSKDRPNVSIQSFPLPDSREMDAWIQKEAAAQGGKFSGEAAHELAQSIGNDTSIASQEIGKLLIYVNGARPVSREDVILLVSDAGSSDVFSMLDAMVEGRTREAQQMLHRQLDDTPPEVILGAVIHRFRQLIQVREALDAGEDLRGLIAQRVVFAGKQAEKTTNQARRYSMRELKQVYRRLLELDIQSKTSQLDLASSLEVLVVEMGEK
jgi:DNA polymerase-3 subunit delta